jgi:hypothetical protein
VARNKYNDQQATPAIVLDQLQDFEKRIKAIRTRSLNIFIIKISLLLVLIALLFVYVLTPLYEIL